MVKFARIFLISAAFLSPPPVLGDGILDVLERSAAPFNERSVFFPNWVAVPTASFVIQECPDSSCAGCTSSTITSLTVLNFGSATHTDVTNVYFNLVCGTKNNSGMLAMLPAGTWLYNSVPLTAWTWQGSYLFASNADPCDSPDTGCSCEVSLFLYADIAPCPADGATVQLGVPVWGLLDNCPSGGPWSDAKDSKIKEIRYIAKTVDKAEASPGDTLSYTIYVGKPGTLPTQTVVMDSIPLYMHPVVGSSSPPAESGLGPPMWLKWTIPSTTMISGGTTSALTFQATIDWGNDSDGQAGTAGAPEGARLWNSAQGFWPASDCGVKTFVSQPVRTVVSRFLFWKIGSNDLLFASDPITNDQMEYEIYIKNKSAKKTWWDVTVWDTVPEEIDSWWPTFGIYDDCIGNTMTPTGCARGGAGVVMTAENTTILTWKFDLPPNGTQSLKWSARVRPATTAGTAVRNRISLRAYGKPWAGEEGTGDSQVPVSFTHQAMVVLRTTYFSYNSYAASADQRGTPGFFIVFFPLNLNTNFELWKLEYTDGAGVAGMGGLSATINTRVASCQDMGSADGGGFSVSGCQGMERNPVFYWPYIWDGVEVPYEFDLLYKITTNSPFLWMIMSELSFSPEDACTYVPSTSLNYRGFIHYTVCRVDHDALAVPGHGDRLVIINTNMDMDNQYQANLPTDIHIFRWNWNVPRGWNYVKSAAVDSESAWVPFEGTYGLYNEDNSIYRIISSDSQNIVYQGSYTLGAPPGIGGAFDNHGAIAPNRENGNLVATPGAPANYYAVCHPYNRPPNCVIGNVGTEDATYRLWQYKPYNTSVPDENWPTTLAGTSGYYFLKTTHTVPAGLRTTGNPHIYGSAGLDPTMNNSVNFATLWKIELVSGGPLQIHVGGSMYDTWSGGSNIHASDGHAAGEEFWFFQGPPGGWGCQTTETFVINTFCPKKDVRVVMETSDYGSASYLTDGPDQAVVWMPFSSGNTPRVHKYYVDPASPNRSSLVAQYHQCMYDEKFLSAPFVETGVHYSVYAPPIVYSGQSFWLTVVVMGPAGGTQTDYEGETWFTSSDPTATFPNYLIPTPTLYQWQLTDQGVRIFFDVTMRKLGSQTIIANDATDGTITGLTSVMVVGAAVNLTKEPKLALASSGDTVQFKICWSNYSNATAFDLSITDAVPMGTDLLPGLINTDMVCGVKQDVIVDVAFSTDTTPTVPAVFNPASPGVPYNARWLRWTVRHVGVKSTGCVCFKVTVR